MFKKSYFVKWDSPPQTAYTAVPLTSQHPLKKHMLLRHRLLRLQTTYWHHIIFPGKYTFRLWRKGCCEVNGTAVYAVCGGLSHLTKYDFLNIVKTNIPLRFKENIINFYFHYFNCWFMLSNSEKHCKTPIRLCPCSRNNLEKSCLQSKSSTPY
jgi:hypothetical protein